MKNISLVLFGILTVLLTACGGSGSGDSFNSSYAKTFIIGAQTYVCRSEKAANACGGASQDCSACELQSSSALPITQLCAKPLANTYKVTQNGCVLTLSNTPQTAICTSEGLRLLSATGVTKQQLIGTGALFTSGRVNITTANNVVETITCN